MLPQYKDGIYGFRNEHRFLSNFYPAEVEFRSLKFPTTEHAYQAAKSLNRDDWKLLQGCKSAGVAKRMGRFITIRQDWDKVKVTIMKDLLTQKFQHEELKKMLLDTGDRYIEETNSWNDTFWGVCNGKGRNILGQLLMAIRDDLKD